MATSTATPAGTASSSTSPRSTTWDCRTTTSCAYLWVDDADALYREWAGAGVGGRLQAPSATDYGLTEGAHIDPDGNLIRFGSPPLAPRALR